MRMESPEGDPARVVGAVLGQPRRTFGMERATHALTENAMQPPAKPIMDPATPGRTRRDLIQAGATGFAAVATLGAVPLTIVGADAGASPAPKAGGRPLGDPAAAYPKPPV